MNRTLYALLGGALFAIASCVGAHADRPPPFTAASTSFSDGQPIGLAQVGAGDACGHGQEQAPQVSWANLPAGTRSLAVLLFDPDGNKGLGVVHWVAYNLDPARGQLAQGQGRTTAEGISVGKNSKGALNYRGLCPPAGDSPHHYVLTLIATDKAPGELAEGMSREELLQALNGHSLGAASLVGRYGH